MFLAGCAVGPNYQAPKINVAGYWITPLSNGESQGPADLALWWKKFNDPDLDWLMTKAIESNYDLRLAKDRVREARAERDVAYGGLWPTVNGTASYSRNRWGKNSFPPLPATTALNFNEYNAGFDAAWEIDIFGGTRRAVEAANAEIDSAQYGQRDVLISLLAEVARNYIQLRGFQQRLSITFQNIKIQQEVLDLTNSRFKHGLSSDLDVQEARAVLTQTQSQVPTLETGVQESVYHLADLIGDQPGTLTGKLSSEKPIPLTPPQVPVGLPSDLLQRRPDIQKAERELAAATSRIGQAKADLFPKFSLTGMGGVESLSTNNWFDYASRYGNVGPSMQWDIFEAGRVRAQVRVQNARQEKALDAYQQTILTALEDTEGALTNYAKEQVRRHSLSESFDAETQALELSAKRYKSGLADFIRVLDSERARYQAQDALIQSNQAVSVDLVQLYKALGGGWEN
jgi:multidrug efflux system outer membrane protein